MTRDDLKPIIRFEIPSVGFAFDRFRLHFQTLLLLIQNVDANRKQIIGKASARKIHVKARRARAFKFILETRAAATEQQQQKVSSHSVCKARSEPFINAAQMCGVRSLSSHFDNKRECKFCV